jgi:hypothetical protein
VHALNIDISIRPLLCGTKPGGAEWRDEDGNDLEIRQIDFADQDYHGRDICAELGEVVQIRNKKRERFILPVYSRLDLKDVEIDASDSLLPYGHSCLSDYGGPCCQVSNATDGELTITDLSPGAGCAAAFADLGLRDTCQVGGHRTLFDMRINQDLNIFADAGWRNNALKLENVKISNFYYPMNSLINVTAHGAPIDIINTTFTQLNLCGSILKNRFVLGQNDLSEMTGLTAAERTLSAELGAYQRALLG